MVFAAARTEGHGCKDPVHQATVGLGIELNADFFLILKGFQKIGVIGNHRLAWLLANLRHSDIAGVVENAKGI